MTIPGAAFLLSVEFVTQGMKGMMMHHLPIYTTLEFGVANNILAVYLTGIMMVIGRRCLVLKPSDKSIKPIEREEFIQFLQDNDSANNPVQTLKNLGLKYNLVPLLFSMPQ
jgi:hypothetical protein